MDYVPWKSLSRIVDQYGGDAGVRRLDCADLFRIMAFSQLTWRDSLRDIEICLQANQGKIFHMGLRQVPAKSTISDALNKRDWRIYHDLALKLIDRAKCSNHYNFVATHIHTSSLNNGVFHLHFIS